MIRKHIAATSAVILAALSIQSCAAHRTLTSTELLAPPKEAKRFAHFATTKGQPVVSYVTRDGVVHVFDGRARLEGDTLVFREEETSDRMARHAPVRIQRVAVADLQSVRSEAMDVASSVALTLAVTIGVVLLMQAVIGPGDGLLFYP